MHAYECTPCHTMPQKTSKQSSFSTPHFTMPLSLLVVLTANYTKAIFNSTLLLNVLLPNYVLNVHCYRMRRM